MRGSLLWDITEFGRAVHAEMEALLSPVSGIPLVLEMGLYIRRRFRVTTALDTLLRLGLDELFTLNRTRRAVLRIFTATIF